MRLGLCIALNLLVIPSLAAQEITITGTSRLRYEAITGQPRAGFNDSDTLVNLRTTVAVEYENGAFRLVGEIYDSRTYGAEAGTPLTTNEVNAVEPVQAYVAVDGGDVLGQGSRLGVQAGRFLLNLGSRRLVAADDYRNTTNSYTGLRADISAAGGFSATLIYTLPQRRRPADFDALKANRVAIDRESFDLVLWGGIAAKRNVFGATMGELSYFHLGERDAPGRPTRNRSLETVGFRVLRDPAAERWDYEAEVFYQFGTVRAGLAPAAPLLDVSAWFVHADIGYSFGSKWKPRLSLEFDYASGERAGSTVTRFDTLFGMRRAELGPAGLYNSIGRANILTPGLRLEATPSSRLDWFTDYRPMWLASRTDAFSTTGVRDASGQSGRFAGHQVEGRVRYWLIPKRLRLEANGVLLLKGKFLESAPNAPRNGDTRYVSLNATVSF